MATKDPCSYIDNEIPYRIATVVTSSDPLVDELAGKEPSKSTKPIRKPFPGAPPPVVGPQRAAIPPRIRTAGPRNPSIACDGKNVLVAYERENRVYWQMSPLLDGPNWLASSWSRSASTDTRLSFPKPLPREVPWGEEDLDPATEAAFAKASNYDAFCDTWRPFTEIEFSYKTLAELVEADGDVQQFGARFGRGFLTRRFGLVYRHVYSPVKGYDIHIGPGGGGVNALPPTVQDSAWLWRPKLEKGVVLASWPEPRASPISAANKLHYDDPRWVTAWNARVFDRLVGPTESRTGLPSGRFRWVVCFAVGMTRYDKRASLDGDDEGVPFFEPNRRNSAALDEERVGQGDEDFDDFAVTLAVSPLEPAAAFAWIRRFQQEAEWVNIVVARLPSLYFGAEEVRPHSPAGRIVYKTRPPWAAEPVELSLAIAMLGGYIEVTCLAWRCEGERVEAILLDSAQNALDVVLVVFERMTPSFPFTDTHGRLIRSVSVSPVVSLNTTVRPDRTTGELPGQRPEIPWDPPEVPGKVLFCVYVSLTPGDGSGSAHWFTGLLRYIWVSADGAYHLTDIQHVPNPLPEPFGGSGAPGAARGISKRAKREPKCVVGSPRIDSPLMAHSLAWYVASDCVTARAEAAPLAQPSATFDDLLRHAPRGVPVIGRPGGDRNEQSILKGAILPADIGRYHNLMLVAPKPQQGKNNDFPAELMAAGSQVPVWSTGLSRGWALEFVNDGFGWSAVSRIHASFPELGPVYQDHVVPPGTLRTALEVVPLRVFFSTGVGNSKQDVYKTSPKGIILGLSAKVETLNLIPFGEGFCFDPQEPKSALRLIPASWQGAGGVGGTCATTENWPSLTTAPIAMTCGQDTIFKSWPQRSITVARVPFSVDVMKDVTGAQSEGDSGFRLLVVCVGVTAGPAYCSGTEPDFARQLKVVVLDLEKECTSVVE